ncbi:hypothetical protein GC105_08755 [Alkalibaculum sp. M08DMB]|uniref:Uncharacterized protein n=1 Tax=Alkalibaculum sporogenes TaxID=2655001 RepID=A0A6A7K8S9_9FIRM|nr:hypothetical protein [Alkalibaculum sporogenes]MPW25878.1 hypothetical protein [Alkalibaculum sporogenes]
MKHELKKVCRIVDEMLTLLLHDTTEVDFKIINRDEKVIIHILGYNTKFDDEYIDTLKIILNKQRQAEVEEYYWQLAGETESDELVLVSAMVDHATVEKQDGNLYIELIRLYT